MTCVTHDGVGEKTSRHLSANLYLQPKLLPRVCVYISIHTAIIIYVLVIIFQWKFSYTQVEHGANLVIHSRVETSGFLFMFSINADYRPHSYKLYLSTICNVVVWYMYIYRADKPPWLDSRALYCGVPLYLFYFIFAQ